MPTRTGRASWVRPVRADRAGSALATKGKNNLRASPSLFYQRVQKLTTSSLEHSHARDKILIRRAFASMAYSRTIFAVLVSIALVLAPVVSMAMAKPCSMTSQMSEDGDGKAKCPCHGSMLDCGSMPQCRTAAGCASQCFTISAIVPAVLVAELPDYFVVTPREGVHCPSLAIRPPTPPPRV